MLRLNSVNGRNLVDNKVHAVTCQVPECGLVLPASNPVASIPIPENKATVATVSNEIVLSLSFCTWENVVMELSHLAGSNTAMHVVFLQIFMHQLE